VSVKPELLRKLVTETPSIQCEVVKRPVPRNAFGVFALEQFVFVLQLLQPAMEQK